MREIKIITIRYSMSEILQKSFETDPLSYEEAMEILNLSDEYLPELLNIVYAVRKKYKGNTVVFKY